MFNTIEPESPSIVRWLLQLLGSAMVPMFVLFKTAALLKPESVLFDYFLIISSSAGLAAIVYFLAPICVTEGVYIWIVPVMLELLLVLYGQWVGESITNLFYGEGLGELATVIFTFPVLGTCIYSLTMWAVHRGKRKTKEV